MDITVIAVTLNDDHSDIVTLVVEGHISHDEATQVALDDYNEMMREGKEEINADDDVEEEFEPYALDDLLLEYSVESTQTQTIARRPLQTD